jgi:NitT/TauT family transport system substrate-binding protein
MRFEHTRGLGSRLSVAWWVGIAAASWLALISWLHYQLNFEHEKRPVVRMGYMPVITNLACPLLDYASRTGTGVRFEALKFSSFAEMGEALRNAQIQAAFIIAPLSIVLHQQGADVRIVYIGNRHESTLVVRKDLNVTSFRDLAGKTLAVPMRYSRHNLCARQLVEKNGMSGSDLRIVEMNPPDMASALATGGLDAYFVGEPFAAKTVWSGESRVLYYVRDIWPGFICNLLIVKQDFIRSHPDRVQALVEGAARSGFWARNNVKEAARVAASYWNQPLELVEYALQNPPNMIVFDRYMPKQDEIQYLADQMVRYNLLQRNDITDLVEDRFAKNANLDGITDVGSIIRKRK